MLSHKVSPLPTWHLAFRVGVIKALARQGDEPCARHGVVCFMAGPRIEHTSPASRASRRFLVEERIKYTASKRVDLTRSLVF
jgi:hypothetical protein